jgi:hypothetical protein
MSKQLCFSVFRILNFIAIFIGEISFVSAQAVPDSFPAWHVLHNGLSYREVDAPEKSILNDSKIFILKSDPQLCDFNLYCASQHGKQNRTADGWAKDFGATVVINAGMFNMVNKSANKGYLKSFSHINNPQMNGNYNVMIGMNPKGNSDTSLIICDMTCRDLSSVEANYNTLCQGMRMVDCNGNPMAWDKRPGQACSMVIGATDSIGNIYFVFTRSPYTHQKMIGFLFRLIPNIRTTVYLEGGPEASLYIQTRDTVISKIGSYVSKTYPTDKNDHFWKIPNVIGINAK